MSIEEILDDDEYLEIIHPSNLFEDISEVKDFLEVDCTLEDLECFLKTSLAAEEYSYCNMIQNKIQAIS